MSVITINEPVEDKEYPITYAYVIGHGFSASDYKAEIIGRFGTTTEAEDHIEKVNKEVKDEGGCIAFKEEFPFLILEILTIEFEKDKEKEGIPYKFYSFDWEKIEYVESTSNDKTTVLDEYKERAKAFMESLDDDAGPEDAGDDSIN